MTENTGMTESVIEKRGILSQSTKENLKIYWFKFSKNKFSVLGLCIVLVSIFLAIFSPQVVPYPQHLAEFVDYANASQAPNMDNWFGTDIYGRDVFSRVLFSFRGAILMCIIVLGISTPVGVALGLLAGYYNGTWLDSAIMRVTDVFLAIPALILALAIAAVLKPGMVSSMIAVTVMWWPWYTRLVYGMATSISKEYFVKNAELIGAKKLNILFKQILPSTLSPILTKMALDVGWIILIGASLSFVGLGEQPPTPAFGQMISDGSKYLPELWWMAIFPSVGIAFIILGFNFFGDGIRDMLDRGRQ